MKNFVLFLNATLFLMPMAFGAQEFKHSGCNISFDDAFPSEERSKVLEAIHFLDDIEGNESSKMHKTIFGAQVNGETYCNFLKRNIRRFDFVNTPTDYVAANFFGIMFITPSSLKLNRVWLASAFMHEAAHSQNKQHVACPKPFIDINGDKIRFLDGTPIAGELACDVDAFGSYGVQYVFGKDLNKYCINCSQEDLEEANSFAEIAIKRVISTKAARKLKRNH